MNQRVSLLQAHDIRVVRQGTSPLIGCWRPYISAWAFLTVGRALINPPDSLLRAIATEKSQNGGRTIFAENDEALKRIPRRVPRGPI